MNFLEKLNRLNKSILDELGVCVSNTRNEDTKIVYFMDDSGIYVLGNIFNSKFISENSEKFEFVESLIDKRLKTESLIF